MRETIPVPAFRFIALKPRPPAGPLGPAWSLGAVSAMLMLLLLAVVTGPARANGATSHQFLADGFDFPVGFPDAEGYYRARGYWPNGHLGEDWNGTGGGNTDMGDPIYAIGRGVVVFSEDFKHRWGNVIIIRHAFRDLDGKIRYIDSLYGHLKERKKKVGDKVRRGELIGTMGDGGGYYYAHLHFEIRKNLHIGMARSSFDGGYSNYHNPKKFIDERRRLRTDFRRVEVPMDTFDKSGPAYPETPKVTVSGKKEPGRVIEEYRSGADGEENMESFWQKLKAKLGGGKK